MVSRPSPSEYGSWKLPGTQSAAPVASITQPLPTVIGTLSRMWMCVPVKDDAHVVALAGRSRVLELRLLRRADAADADGRRIGGGR